MTSSDFNVHIYWCDNPRGKCRRQESQGLYTFITASGDSLMASSRLPSPRNTAYGVMISVTTLNDDLVKSIGNTKLRTIWFESMSRYVFIYVWLHTTYYPQTMTSNNMLSPHWLHTKCCLHTMTSHNVLSIHYDFTQHVVSTLWLHTTCCPYYMTSYNMLSIH